MNTSSSIYQGGGVYMSCGSLAKNAPSETNDHWVTMHFGCAYSDGTPCWTEVGVLDYYGTLTFYTFTNNPKTGEYGWGFHGAVGSNTYQNAFTIRLTGLYDSVKGYQYKTYINNNEVRSGYIQSFYNNVDFANEAFSDTGTFTSDTINAHFVNPFLYTSSGSGGVWSGWSSGAVFNATSPQAYNSYLNAGSYVFDCWTSIDTIQVRHNLTHCFLIFYINKTKGKI